ncbi:Proline-rich antigen [Geobacillus sp. WSUCF1]|nr:Proline-rich antigen [Geobacillus sp. WSUCF1]
MTDMQITATLADHLPPAERPPLLRRLLASFLGVLP